MTDLSLIPMDDLLKEIIKRTENCVIAFTIIEDSGPPLIYVNHVGAQYLTCLGLVDVLREHIHEIRKEETQG